MNKSSEEKLIEAIFSPDTADVNDQTDVSDTIDKDNQDDSDMDDDLIILKKEILDNYSNPSGKYKNLTTYLAYCHNNIWYHVNRKCLNAALFFASRIFHVLGSKDEVAYAMTKILFRRLISDFPDAKDDSDVSILFFKKNKSTHNKGEFKVPFKRYIEVAFDVFAKNFHREERLLTMLFDDTLSITKKVISSKEFMDNYYQLEDKNDAFYDYEKYKLKDPVLGASNVLWMLDKTTNIHFKRTLVALNHGAPIRILDSFKKQTLCCLLTIATYNHADFTCNDFEYVCDALNHRLNRLFDRYVKFYDYWSNEIDLMLYNDLLEIALDPYAFDEQLDETDDND